MNHAVTAQPDGVHCQVLKHEQLQVQYWCWASQRPGRLVKAGLGTQLFEVQCHLE
jgi:hypothetical protein